MLRLLDAARNDERAGKFSGVYVGLRSVSDFVRGRGIVDRRFGSAREEKSERKRRIMKIKRTINLFLSLILIGAMLACKSSSSASLNENADAKSYGGADDSTFAEANKNASTPVPIAKHCPLEVQSFSAKDVEDGAIDKYNGCTINVAGKLQAVSPEYATIYDADSNKTVSCGGNFSSETYSAIGHKLYDLKSKGWGNSKFPDVRFSAKVKLAAGASSALLTDCVMTSFNK